MVKVILASSACSMRVRSDSHCLFIFSFLFWVLTVGRIVIAVQKKLSSDRSELRVAGWSLCLSCRAGRLKRRQIAVSPGLEGSTKRTLRWRPLHRCPKRYACEVSLGFGRALSLSIDLTLISAMRMRCAVYHKKNVGQNALVSDEKTKSIPRCNSTRASHEKSSFSQERIKLSSKSFWRAPGKFRNRQSALKDFYPCRDKPTQSNRCRPISLCAGHARSAPRSWLLVCRVLQSISRPRSQIVCNILVNSHAARLTSCICGMPLERSSNLMTAF